MPGKKKSRKPGVCAYIAQRLRAGDETDAVLSRVRRRFPQSKASARDVSIVRRELAKPAAKRAPYCRGA
jgi:hypothetical protein